MTVPPLRAPQQDRDILAIPQLCDLGNLIAANRRRFDAPSPFGGSWQELRSRARKEALAVARRYHQEAGEPAIDSPGASFILAGHQPELFHPGVWIKNFALNALAKAHGATPLNLVIDTDTAKSAALHVPVLTPESETDVDILLPEDDAFAPLPPLPPARPLAHLARAPFDLWQGDVPFEERRVLDEQLFASFPERVRQLQHGWNFEPMLADFWKEVMRQAQRTNLLGERFAAARRAFERRWGVANLEAPMSRLCETEAFAAFARHLMDNAARFHEIYNRLLAEYRLRHGIASRRHPVPDLARDGDWIELPLWAWQAGDTRRSRLFVRSGSFDLRAGLVPSPLPPLPLGERGRGEGAAGRDNGYKIRSRALTTTLFARLFLGDLFIHGIGGAKYDELTDDIIRAFYGIEPPEYTILSATLLLPLPRFPATPSSLDQLKKRRRELWYNPQRDVVDATPARSASEESRGAGFPVCRQAGKPASRSRDRVVDEKRHLIGESATTKAARRRRYRCIREVNRELREFVRPELAEVTAQLVRMQQALEANAVLRRRDFAFCLYPEEAIRTLACSLDGSTP